MIKKNEIKKKKKCYLACYLQLQRLLVKAKRGGGSKPRVKKEKIKTQLRNYKLQTLQNKIKKPKLELKTTQNINQLRGFFF